jgi:hypothetical protein
VSDETTATSPATPVTPVTPVTLVTPDGHLRVDELSRDLKRRSTRSGALMITSFTVQLVSAGRIP